MREHLKSEFLEAISNRFSTDDMTYLGRRLDEVLARYDITKAETSLAIIGREEFEKLIKTYLVVKRMEGLSEKTLEQYTIYLNKLLFSMYKPPAEITTNDIRLFLFQFQKERNISNRTLDRIRSIVCGFFRWAACEQYIPRSPVETLKPIKFEETPRKAISQIELEMLRRSCSTPRELAILEMLYSTGCRVSELIGIKLSDINWSENSVHLFGKGKKHRTSYLNAKAVVATREYLNTRKHESEYVFCNDRGGDAMKKENVERMVRKLAKRAGLEGITPHVMRHTTATQALQSGMPIQDIQLLLGHASVSTTMIYAKTSMDAVHAGHKRCVV